MSRLSDTALYEVWLHEETMTTALVVGNYGTFYWNGKKEESFWGLMRIKSERRGWVYICDLPNPNQKIKVGDFVRIKKQRLTKEWLASREEVKDRRWRRVTSVYTPAGSKKPFLHLEGVMISYLVKDFELKRKLSVR